MKIYIELAEVFWEWEIFDTNIVENFTCFCWLYVHNGMANITLQMLSTNTVKLV